MEETVLRQRLGELRSRETRDVSTRASAERMRALKLDYEAMRDMYLSEPAAFDDVMAAWRNWSSAFNGDVKAGTSSA